MPTDHIENVLAGPVGNLIKQQWIFLAQPYASTGQYVRGIQQQQHYSDPNSFAIEYPFGGTRLAVSVKNTVPYAMIVELGHQGFHLPERVRNWPHQIRRGPRAGIGYMRIPFRHFVPAVASSTGRAIRGQMPPEIYERMKELRNRIAFHRQQFRYLATQRPAPLRGLGDLYKQSKSYIYYRAIEPNFPSHLARPGYTWRASKYEGMIRPPQVTPHANQGFYMTFRTMTQDSQGWYIPAQPGRHLARQTAERVGPIIAPLIADAARDDLVHSFSTVLSGAGFEVRVQ